MSSSRSLALWTSRDRVPTVFDGPKWKSATSVLRLRTMNPSNIDNALFLHQSASTVTGARCGTMSMAHTALRSSHSMAAAAGEQRENITRLNPSMNATTISASRLQGGAQTSKEYVSSSSSTMMSSNKRRRHDRSFPPDAFRERFASFMSPLGMTPEEWIHNHHRRLLLPLTTHAFTFERDQLVSLGDSIIQREVSRHVSRWIMHRNIVCSPNVVRQLVALLHNHHVCRWHADGLNFLALRTTGHGPDVVTTTFDTSVSANEHAAGSTSTESAEHHHHRINAAAYDALVDSIQEVSSDVYGPSRKELSQTTIGLLYNRWSQADTAPLLSHFVGAVHVALGPQRAKDLVDIIWRLSDVTSSTTSINNNEEQQQQGSVGKNSRPSPRSASAAASVMDSIVEAANGSMPAFAVGMLSACLTKYPAANVARSILAAQGISAVFETTRTFAVPVSLFEDAAAATSFEKGGDGKDHHSQPSSSHANAESGSGDTHPNRSPSLVPSAAARGGDDIQAAASPSSTLPPADSPAFGPGGFNAMQRWKDRNLAKMQKELASPSTPNGAESVLASKITSGWLEEPEKTPQEARTVVVPRDMFFADHYGSPAPVEGRTTAPTLRLGPVKDKITHINHNAGKDGVPFETNGLSAAEFVKSFSSPHERRFEVTMRAVHPFEQTLGVAVHKRFTGARCKAAEVFLGRIVDDMSKLSS